MVTTTTRFKVVTAVEPGKPKLDNLKITPTEVKAGGPFTVSYRITNEGKGPMTGVTTIKFACPGPVCIPERRMPSRPMPAGGSTTESAPMTMPVAAVAGDYTITVTYEVAATPTFPGVPSFTPKPDVFATAKATIS